MEEGKKADDRLSEEEQQELQDALAKLRTKVDVLEERAQLNEIKFHHEDYKEVSYFDKSFTNDIKCINLQMFP